MDEIVETQTVVETIAASLNQDKKKIAVIGGVLEGAVNEFSNTHGALK